MTAAAVDARRPSLWLAAATELAVAATVAMILLPMSHYAGRDTAGTLSHSMPGMHWSAVSTSVVLVTGALLVWWLATRARVPAVTAALGIVFLGASEPVRTAALQSHLIGMAALEALLVGVPLLLVSAWRAPATHRRHANPWTVSVLGCTGLYGAALIALHLPTVHDRGAQLGVLPSWLPILIALIGTGYWTAILSTAIRPAVRRGALIIGQEIAAILGLAALIAPSSGMQHPNLLGLSSTVDHRLGGLLMIAACAAVMLPLLKRIDHPLGSEPNVH